MPLVQSALKSPWQVAVQNVSATSTGAFTGELAAEQIADLNIPWVIIGHSERRQLFGETDETVAKKVAVCQKINSLSIIACIGETLSERKENKTLDIVFRQMKAIAGAVTDWTRIVIAYEPVWAIGTGVNATPDQAQEVHAALRTWLSRNVNAEVAGKTRIIYGGSVKGSNAAELSSKADIDGFLVGGASLIAADFQAIVKSHSPKSAL